MSSLADLFARARAAGIPRYRTLSRAELERALAASPSADDAPGAPAPVRLDVADGLATITLCDPARRNALGEDAFAALDGILARLEADPDVRLVAVAAEGPAFCAGAAALEYDGLPDGAERLSARGTAVLDRLAALPVPVVALLQGHAVGGGAELALACDLRLAAPAAELRLVHVGIGLVPGWGGGLRLARLVGDAAAFRLLALRARVGGEEALRLGLVDELVPAERLAARAAELAAEVGGGERAAIARLKALSRLPEHARAEAARLAFVESWPARRLDHVRPRPDPLP